MDRKRDRSRLNRSSRHSAAFGGSRGLTVCLALLVAVVATLYGGHPNIAVAQSSQFATEISHGHSAASEHDHQKPCSDVGHTHHQGTSCASASGCSLCVPVDIQIFATASVAQPTATAPPFVSSPGDVPIRLRPPQALVIA